MTPPPPRRGPRPLLLHLTLAMARLSVSGAGSMPWKPGSPNWNSPNPALSGLLDAEAAFLDGVKAWRAHPWRRDLADPPTLWSEGTARLLDFGGSGPTILFVPSLVNRWTVLDLMAEHSMLRYLAGQGLRPLVLDWGEPEPSFTLTDYIAGRLVRAIQAAGGPVILAGYCMGGTFATAAAALRPDLIVGLVLLAAPWDFHAGGIERLHKQAAARTMLEPLLTASPLIPVDVLQALFALDDPAGVAEKFRRFGRMAQDGPAARLFVALEDWLNDGIPLSARTVGECLRDWYGDNLPMRGLWRVAGLAIDPAAIAAPAFAAIAARDRIVPPGSARGLVSQLRDPTVIEPEAGHVGMTAGGAARTVLWEPVRDWVLSQGVLSKGALPGGGKPSRRKRR